MRKNLTVCFIIPLSDEEFSEQRIAFYQWIPENTLDVIVVNYDDKEVRIHADKSCVPFYGEENREDFLSKCVNIPVAKLKVEILAHDIEEELVNFIYDERDSRKNIHHGLKPEDDQFERLQRKYKELGIDVVKHAIHACNRIISYARNIKGQYWLTELTFDENMLNSMNISFSAKSKIEDGEWFNWCPPNTDRINVDCKSDACSIKKSDWENISAFVRGTNRPDLVYELLANARFLFDSGHMRSSVIEAVSALEISVFSFSKKANVQLLSTVCQTERIDIHRINTQIKHLGFSGSMKYLIPLLFNEEALPSDILKKYYEAIEIRNNVVHKGQRVVSAKVVNEILMGVSACCDILNAYEKKLS